MTVRVGRGVGVGECRELEAGSEVERLRAGKAGKDSYSRLVMIKKRPGGPGDEGLVSVRYN